MDIYVNEALGGLVIIIVKWVKLKSKYKLYIL